MLLSRTVSVPTSSARRQRTPHTTLAFGFSSKLTSPLSGDIVLLGRVVLGYFYPALASAKTAVQQDPAAFTQWMTYWYVSRRSWSLPQHLGRPFWVPFAIVSALFSLAVSSAPGCCLLLSLLSTIGFCLRLGNGDRHRGNLFCCATRVGYVFAGVLDNACMLSR